MYRDKNFKRNIDSTKRPTLVPKIHLTTTSKMIAK